MNPYLAALIAAVASVVVGWLGFIASRAKQRADTGQQMIDQHQEDIKELRADRENDRRRIDRLERIGRVKDDYIDHLRDHISERRPPPPPPYPSGLISRE